MRPDSVRGVHGIHLSGNLFAQLAPGFAADNIDGLAPRDLIEPGSEDGVGRKPVRVAGKIDEDGLRDLLGQLRGANLAKRCGMNEIKVAPDDFGEGLFGLVPCVARKQFQIRVAHLYKHNVGGGKNPAKNLIRSAKSSC